MKRLISFILIVLLLLPAFTMPAFANDPIVGDPEDIIINLFSNVDDALQYINTDIRNVYGNGTDQIFSFERNMAGRNINENLLVSRTPFSSTFSSLIVYGSPHGDFRENRNRFLGYTALGDQYTNIQFPDDRTVTWTFVGQHTNNRFIVEPWRNPASKGINMTLDDTYSRLGLHDTIKDNITEGILWYYGTYKNDGRIPNEAAFRAIDWTPYVHILQPPTNRTWGMGRLWHWDNGSLWYFTIPIVPFSMLNQPSELTQVDIVEDHEGNHVSTSILTPNMSGDDVLLSSSPERELQEWVTSDTKIGGVDDGDGKKNPWLEKVFFLMLKTSMMRKAFFARFTWLKIN